MKLADRPAKVLIRFRHPELTSRRHRPVEAGMMTA
jgi:hypothetical protein